MKTQHGEQVSQVVPAEQLPAAESAEALAIAGLAVAREQALMAARERKLTQMYLIGAHDVAERKLDTPEAQFYIDQARAS